MTRIFKFGGASVRDADAIVNLGQIIRTHSPESLVVIVSAMGESTNVLEKLAHLSFSGQLWKSPLEKFLTFHVDVCKTLFDDIPKDVRNWMVTLQQRLDSPKKDWFEFYDSIVSVGELLSTTIVAKYLQEDWQVRWLDARDYIKTDGFFTQASIDWTSTQSRINKLKPILSNELLVTQGFIGSSSEGETVTLGREGSDFSASVFANCLDAEEVVVWKDVPGVLTADPKLMPNAGKFEELTYQEATEMTYYGAKVIHPKTLKPLAQKQIPLLVRSFLDIQENGTRIVHSHHQKTLKPCFVYKFGQLLVSLHVRDNSFMDEKKMMMVFETLDKLGVKVNLIQNSALSFSFCFDDDPIKLKQIKTSFQDQFAFLFNHSLHLATIKNYDDKALEMLPVRDETFLEQKTRHTYQVLYSPKDIG
ncbi:MAG: aspartate kinase [Cyclobacteriaceae bacterium]|nr:aspartate kinase [Cyclobacteriaceae bacterium HetDA_MAG_MS6]